MPIEDSIVSVAVSLSGPGITRAGFGTPLVLNTCGGGWGGADRVRAYTDQAGVVDDFGALHPVALATAAMFSQAQCPPTIKVGRADALATTVKVVSVRGAHAGVAYGLRLFVPGGTPALSTVTVTPTTPAAWQATHAYSVGDIVQATASSVTRTYVCRVAGTSSSSAPSTQTTALVVDGTVSWGYLGLLEDGAPGISRGHVAWLLAEAINDAGLGVTADQTQGTPTWGYPNGHVALTAAGAGAWFAVEPLAADGGAGVPVMLAVSDATAYSPGAALDACLDADHDWYAFCLIHKGAAVLDPTQLSGAAKWAQTNKRLLLVSLSDTLDATEAAGGGVGALQALADAGQSYVAGMYHPREWEFFDAAKLAYFLATDPGSENWRLKTLVGVTPTAYTAQQRTNLLARRAAFYARVGGRSVDAGLGQVCDPVVAFVDVRRGLDWYTANLQADLIDLLLVNNKVAHTDAGLRLIALAIASRNTLGIEAGLISPDVDPVVTVPRASKAGTFDAATRALSGVSTAWKLAGAINSITVNVQVTQ